MPIEFARLQVGRIFMQRCAYLFAALLILLVLLPVSSETAQGKIALNLANVAVLIAAIAAMGRSAVWFVIAVLLAAPVVGFQFAGIYAGEPRLLAWSWAFGAAFYFVTLSFLLRYVFRKDVISADKLFGAAAAYLMLGVLWAYFYTIAEYLHPGAFSFNGTVVDALGLRELVYFSFTVLTSTGFGDIAAIVPVARTLVTLQQVCGVLFVATLIARLAGIYSPDDDASA